MSTGTNRSGEEEEEEKEEKEKEKGVREGGGVFPPTTTTTTPMQLYFPLPRRRVTYLTSTHVAGFHIATLPLIRQATCGAKGMDMHGVGGGGRGGEGWGGGGAKNNNRDKK